MAAVLLLPFTDTQHSRHDVLSQRVRATGELDMARSVLIHKLHHSSLLFEFQCCLGISTAERKELRENMMQSLKTRHKHLPAFITSKWIKFFVLIARTDWPQDYPEFFEYIYELIQSQEYSHLGLTFLLIASEELANPR